jgi:hypothetical protein
MAGLVDAAVDHDGQAIRAVLLAIAIATCLADMRPSSFVTKGCLSGHLCAWRRTLASYTFGAFEFALRLGGWSRTSS